MSQSPATSDPAGPSLGDTVLIIPALNEEDCVADTIARWWKLAPMEIRVVDNGSTDTTALRASVAGARVISEPKRGYGAAAWRGIQELPTDCQRVIFCSADGSDRLDESELREWRKHADRGVDLIVGDRTKRVESRHHLKAVQSFGNRLSCLLIRAGWGRSFRDLGSLRWINRGALERLNLRDRGFGWNVEMQVRAVEHGMRIVELPVSYHPRQAGTSKISGTFLGTLRAGSGILRMFWLLHRSRLDSTEHARRSGQLWATEREPKSEGVSN